MAFGQLIEELERQLRVEEPDFARCEVIIKELKVYSFCFSFKYKKGVFQ